MFRLERDIYSGGKNRLFNTAIFSANFADLGSGAVDLTIKGTGSASFTRATAATMVLSNGLIGSVATGVARSCYSATGNYLGYLTEEQRTNLVLQSEDFSTTWAAVGTPTFTKAGDTCGSVVLNLIGDDAAGALEGYTQTVTYTGNGQKSVSLFVKLGTSTSSVVRLRDTTASADRLLVAITWTGSVPTTTYTTGTEDRPISALGNGVYRIHALTASVTAANTNSLQAYPATNAALATTGTGNILMGGMQTENAVFATSYIPTTTGTVQRNADVLTYPTAGNLSDTAGTCFAEYQMPTLKNTARIVGDGNTTGSPALLAAATSLSGVLAYDGANEADGPAGTPANGTIIKVACVWPSSANKFKVFVNGVPGTAATYDGAFSLSSIGIGVGGSVPLCGTIRKLRIWNFALTDAQVATL